MGPRKASAQATLPPFPFSHSPSSSSSQHHTTAMSPASRDTAAASSAGKTSPSTTNTKASKSKTIILKLSPKSLAQFPHEKPPPPPPPASTRVKSEASATPTPSAAAPAKSSDVTSKKDVTVAASETPVPAAATPSGADSNAASTPAPSNGLLAPPPNAAKRKGVPGPKPGMKRTASQLDASGVPKPRGKPGPKKKARIGENGEVLNGAAPAAPKLGPKANQGAINACLRALDRSGAPCRKWSRKAFSVRSFTGYNWGAGSYAAPLRKVNGDGFEGDVKSDDSSTGEASGEKRLDSSAVMSEKSTSGLEVDTPAGAVGSPAVTATA